jgi:dihydropteroate synthase-like protein
MGAGNVTELIDADSVGVNALLAGIASELGVALLFTVEASAKTYGSVSELSTAAKMMYLAAKRAKNPKDIGINLLKLKDKRALELIEDARADKLKVILSESRPPTLEDASYRIYLKEGKIFAVEYGKKGPVRKYTGISAEALYKKICSTVKISAEHADYLGKELAKAEIALKLGKNYIQDEDLL